MEIENTDISSYNKSQQPPAPATAVTQALLKHVVSIAELSDASAVFVYADVLEKKALPLPENPKFKVFYITRTVREEHEQLHKGAHFIRQNTAGNIEQ